MLTKTSGYRRSVYDGGNQYSRHKPVVVNAQPDSRRGPDRATLSARDASQLLRRSSD